MEFINPVRISVQPDYFGEIIDWDVQKHRGVVYLVRFFNRKTTCGKKFCQWFKENELEWVPQHVVNNANL